MVLWSGETPMKPLNSLLSFCRRRLFDLLLFLVIMLILEKLWKSKSIPTELKVNLFQTTCLSILLYGCESWTLTQEARRWTEQLRNKLLPDNAWRQETRFHTEWGPTTAGQAEASDPRNTLPSAEISRSHLEETNWGAYQQICLLPTSAWKA